MNEVQIKMVGTSDVLKHTSFLCFQDNVNVRFAGINYSGFVIIPVLCVGTH